MPQASEYLYELWLEGDEFPHATTFRREYPDIRETGEKMRVVGLEEDGITPRVEVNRGVTVAIDGPVEVGCSSCGSFHLGVVPCGMTWIERMKTITVHPAATPTKTAGSKTYYDPDPIKAAFGDDTREKLLDDTDGTGALVRGPDRKLYRKDRHSGEVLSVSPKETEDFLLGGSEEVDPF